MYALFMIIGILIGGATNDWTSISMFIGGVVALIIALLIHFLFKSGSAGSAFDTCVIFLIFEGLVDL